MEQRFLCKVDKHSGVYKNSLTTECWNWIAFKNKAGYGQFKMDGKMHRAHRVSYELYKGEITKGLVVRHSCDNTSCVRPEHLEVGTLQDNTDDMMKRGRHKCGITIQKGEKNGNVKLIEADIPQIRQMLQNGVYHKIIAELFGVSSQQISKINTGKTWSHI